MTIQQYIFKLNQLYTTGSAREHSYRGDLQALISAILPDVLVTNEPARISCGAPDYMLSRKEIPIGYIEAKDIGVDLQHKSLKEQFDRYKLGLSNLIITDYLHFQFFKDGEFVTDIRIGKVENGQIFPLPENFHQFENLISNFALSVSQALKSPTRLAKMMAGKAKLMADVIEKSLNSDDEHNRNSNLKSQMISFRQMLIHDITNRSFADIYAQTIAYGMFAARYHDPTLQNFSRTEAAQLIPKSNPFLRKLFQDIAGFDLDDRLTWIVDELVQIFLASDVAKIMTNFGKTTKQEDPVVHFYETFLAEYNPALRKARGVWYTPQPVVNFIVRAVDDILKREFGLPQGLADTSKTKISLKIPTHDKRFSEGMRDYETEVHKVQILDPATGTGTFLAEVVKHIHRKFEGQQGIWSHYVSKDLIPRLNGFELLMASYAMAHLKMDMLLTETGYKPADDQRLRIFLTNSLEEAHPDTGTLFSSWLSDEANQANAIKRDTPVMCVIGNPPYSGISSNNGKWISDLIEDYKYVDGEHFNERKHWLNDDYVKFMRFGQYFIEKNGEGILAFINPHGYLDNPTFRGMRWNLLKTYDKLYTIDLHGNSKKKETAPDGSADENVFDIMQGVSINVFVKTGKKKENELGEIFHYDCYGKREAKYEFLNGHNLNQLEFKKLEYTDPFYFFVPKDENGRKEYEQGILISDLYPNNTSGIVTMGDDFIISDTKKELKERIIDFLDKEYSEEELKRKYSLGKNYANWIIGNKHNIHLNEKEITRIDYRPFDKKWTMFNRNLVWRWRENTMKHLFEKQNYALIVPKQVPEKENTNAFITTTIAGHKTCSAYNVNNIFPLYLYPETSEQQTTNQTQQTRKPNLNMEIVAEIEKSLGLSFVPEKEEGNVCMANNEEVRADFRTVFAPIDLLDYIYAVLHSPAYREKYKEFLKIDFPRVPYPTDAEKFWELVKLGGELRKLHLLESPKVNNFITQYPIDGDNIVTRKMSKSSPGFTSAPLKAGSGSVSSSEVENSSVENGSSLSTSPKAGSGNVSSSLSTALKTGSVENDSSLSAPLKAGSGNVSSSLSTALKTGSVENDSSLSAPLKAGSGERGKVWINDTQYFDNVPLVAWEFYIGGYQPAQKWLKDRQGRELNFEDILHYQKMIVALTETERIMEEIMSYEL